jgi:hypothetical protein
MERIICECCNKKKRPIKNGELREYLWKKHTYLNKLCKSCHMIKTDRCDNCMKRFIKYNFG